MAFSMTKLVSLFGKPSRPARRAPRRAPLNFEYLEERLAMTNLDYTFNWLGNTHSGEYVPQGSNPNDYYKFVQSMSRDMGVGPNGDVYTNSDFEEGSRPLGVYSNATGEPLLMFETFDSPLLGGYHLATNATYMYASAVEINDIPDNEIWRYTVSNRAPAPFSGGTGNGARISIPGTVDGLIATDTRVYVATGQNTIRVYDQNMQFLSSFNVTGPKKLEIDSAGFLWVQTSDNQLKRYSTTGALQSQSITLPAGSKITDLDIDASTGRLLVADGGADHNIKVYQNITTSPTLHSTFGVTGGATSGTSGDLGERRFLNINGVGTDASGNIFVQQYWPEGVVLEKYTAAGARLWRQYGLMFGNSVVIDPADGVTGYSVQERYTLDYSKPAGTEMATWNNWLMNAAGTQIAYDITPGAEPALHERHVSQVVNLSGQKFLITNGLPNSDPSVVYRVSGNRLINTGAGAGAWGKGNIDSNGNLWAAEHPTDAILGKIFKLNYLGLDSNQMPVWDTANPIAYDYPTDFYSNDNWPVVWVHYVAETDTMYVNGWRGEDQNFYNLSAPNIARYDNWSNLATRSRVWLKDTSFQDVGDDDFSGVKSFAVAGNYMFVGNYWCEGTARVFDLATGNFVVNLAPPSNNAASTSTLDHPSAVRAFLRPNGEYVVTVEDVAFAKTLVYRWNPGAGATNPPAAPSALGATAVSSSQINLSWTDNATDETGFTIERATNSGFTAGLTTATVGANATSYNATGLAASTTYYFRVRATNNAGASSNSNTANATTQAASSNVVVNPGFESGALSPWTVGVGNGSVVANNARTGTYAGRFGTSGAGSLQQVVAGLSTNTTYTLTAWVKGVSGGVTLEVGAENYGGAEVSQTVQSATYTQLTVTFTTGALNTSATIYAFGEGYVDDVVVSTGAAPSPPAAPSGLSATAASSSQINLAWTDNSNNEDGFTIERATNSGFTAGLTTATVGANAASYSATGLAASTTYYFRVRATNAGGSSANSNAANATTQAAVTIPAAPSGLSATAVSSSQINLAWTDNANNETGFTIERATNSGFTANLTTATVGANVTSYNATGLAASTTYYFRVRATNSAGASANSNTANATTQAAVTIPAAPSGLTALVASSSRINLAWTDNANNETGFTIERATNSGFTANLTTATVGANVTSYSATGLAASTTYYFRVRATNSAGASSNSNTASGATQAAGSPAAPSGLTATANSSTQVTLAWTDNSGNESGFRIERRTGTTGSFSLVATTSANATSFVNTALTANTQYQYRVRANGGGNSAWSALATVTTPVGGASLLSLNKAATASSTNGSQGPPSAVTDGNTSTRWLSGNATSEWIYIDLGATFNISRVKLNWETAYGSGYKIQVSNNASTWTDIYSTTSGNGGIDDLTGLSGSGRYVRMLGTAMATVWGYSLWEFEVYGS